jgi:hypothetical protein
MGGRRNINNNITMKIRHIIPLWLLAGGITVGAQTTNTPSTQTKTMNYKLTYADTGKTVPNPTEADLRTAVAALDGDNYIQFLLSTGNNVLQVNWESKGQFSFYYKQDGGKSYYHTSNHYSAEIVVKVLRTFLNGTDDWQKLVELKPGEV